MTKRCYDAAAVSHCEVTLNGVPIQVKSLSSTSRWFFCSSCRAEQDRLENHQQTMGNRRDALTGLLVQADQFCERYCDNKRWNACQSDESQILKHLVGVMSKKAKSLGLKVTKNSIRNSLICVNCWWRIRVSTVRPRSSS